MAITIANYSIPMPDADFIMLNNGVSAPTISPQGVFRNVEVVIGNANQAVSASSTAGVTTVTLTAGYVNDDNIQSLLSRIVHGAQAMNIRIIPA